MSPATMQFLWLPCLLCLLVACSGSSRAMLSPDGLALLEFKGQITADPKGILENWKDTDETPCGWTGVTCVPSGNSIAAANDSVVSGLNLSYNDLEGSLSGSLGSLANLTRLDLSKNRLAGAIPEEIVNCKLLVTLELSYNFLEGSMPANMSQLRRLFFLSASWNSLSGPVPALDGLTNLAALSLSHNSLSGPVPALAGLTSLSYLDLTGNDFVGDIDAIGFSNLTKLSALKLDDNQFTGSWPNLSGLKNLMGLSSNGNLATGEVPDLSASQDLYSLTMRGAQREGPLPTWIGNLPRLVSVDLAWNNLSGEIPPGMWRNSSKDLDFDLSGNRIGGAIPGDFLQRFPGKLGSSSLLNLSVNRLTGSIPASINGSLVSLRTLDLSNNELDGPIPTWIGSNSSLSYLYLWNNSLSGDIASVWSNGSQFRGALNVLELQGNQLSGNVGEATCGSWENLTRLDLSHNSGVNLVEDSLELMLTNFSNLQVLRLSSIGSAGRLPLSLEARLRTIDSQLEVLDLSCSNLEGDLGLSILADAHFLFTKLQSLNLSGNWLTGQVPPGLAFLPGIRVLDLSNNGLSGPLPPFSPDLHNASFFFAGNPGLCGFPLKACKGPSNKSLVLPLALALVGCGVLFVVSCILFAWRLRKSNFQHQQDAELIAVMQGKNSASLMPLAELRKATANFSNESQIGEGGFGKVHIGKLNNGTTVAIKRSIRQGWQENRDQFLNEVHILSHVNHRNLVRLLGCCWENKEALLVFEYVPSGTVKEHLREPSIPLTWEQRLRIALQTADALAYLHSAANPPIFHRDVKSANILLDEDMNAKVADFGISKLVPLDATRVYTMELGTIGYMDPEYTTSWQFCAKSDVYSFGVVLLELISARPPFEHERGPDDAGLARFAVSLIDRGDLEDIVDPAIAHTFGHLCAGKESIAGVAALAVKCLQPKSRDRPSMKEVSKELRTLWLQLVSPAAASWGWPFGVCPRLWLACQQNESRIGSEVPETEAWAAA